MKLKDEILKKSKFLNFVSLQQIMVQLNSIQVFTNFDQILPLLEVVTKNFEKIPSLREKFKMGPFFWNFPSFDQNSIDKLQTSNVGMKNIQSFVRCKTVILKQLTQECLQILSSGDQ
jgi:hypothetical protein